MKRILIVDDEKYFRKALLVSVNWERAGYTVCGEAENGQEALDKLRLLLPDVVLTDINMSKMNGLTFIEQARAVKPNVKIIVISGYNEFDYARRSLVLGVYNYIVKPIDPDELEQQLVELSLLIEKEKSMVSRMQSLSTTLDSTLSMLKTQYLSQLLSGNVTLKEEDWKGIVEHNAINLIKAPFAVIAIEPLEPPSAQWSSSDRKFWAYAVENIAGELLREKYACETCREDSGRVFAAVCCDANKDRMQQQLASLCYLVQTHLGFSLSIGVGKPRAALAEICSSCKEAVFSLQNDRPPAQKSGICFYMYAQNEKLSGASAALYDKNELLMHLRIGDIDAGVSALRGIKAALRTSQSSLQSVHAAMVEILSAFFHYASENAACFSEKLTDIYAPFFSALLTSGEPEALFAQAEDILRELVTRVRAQQGKRVSAIVGQALRLIHDRYAEEDLTVDCIAQECYTSYGYLCFLFKKDVGQTINDYLTAYRMERAQLLLAKPGATVNEVAQQVGFSNANYFSKIFKKKFGVLPSELRAKS